MSTTYTYQCPTCQQVFINVKNMLHDCFDLRNLKVPSAPAFTAGVKLDAGKEPLDLLSPIALLEVAKVLEFGKNKYAAWNWSKGLAYTRILAAIMRHTLKYMSGEDKDPESGLSHIAHAMCNCMFLLHFEKYRADLDDREKEAFKTLNPGTDQTK